MTGRTFEVSAAAVAPLRRRALLVGAVAAVACGAGAATAPDAFFRAYLVALVYWTGIAGGSLAWLMLQHLSRGGWGLVARRAFEAASRTLPALALAFVPLFLGLGRVYEWARPDLVAADPLLQHKAPYLNPAGFIARTMIFFVLWSLLAIALSRWSAAQDGDEPAPFTKKMRATSAVGLLVYVLTLTFASIDWVMSLDPRWYSSIHGFSFVGGQALASMAFLVVTLAALARRAPASSAAEPRHFHDYGNLLLTFVMIWGYLTVSQFIIIWSGNLPEEITWYLRRSQGAWKLMTAALALLHFFVPFLLLLPRAVKRDPTRLAKVAVFLLVMRWVDLFWQVAPTFSPEGFSFHWLDVAAPVALGGLWTWMFLGELAKRPLVPLHDPRLAEALEAPAHG